MMATLTHLDRHTWGLIFIAIGSVWFLLTWLVVRERRSDLERIIVGLARIGPCTGRELYTAGFAKPGAVYRELEVAIERGLVRVRTLQLTDAQRAIRGNIAFREFRLTTKGWSLYQLYQNE